jgi:dienelactone hydrolase
MVRPAQQRISNQVPLDVAGSLKFPVLGLYGGKDAGIPLDQVEAMRAALRAAGSPTENIVYPDAQHGFNADSRPSYNGPTPKMPGAGCSIGSKNTAPRSATSLLCQLH